MRSFLLFFCFYLYAYNPNMIADIASDVHTEFGIYHPYIVSVTPSCTSYTIEPNFSNVVNFTDFIFTPKEETLLYKNAFVCSPSHYKEIYDIYNYAMINGYPIFVSCDALLHTYHKLYNKILEEIELKELYFDIYTITDSLYSKIKYEYEMATDSAIKNALMLDLAYLSVAKSLLDTTFVADSSVKALVDSELAKINAHEGYFTSPIFNYLEDYSQYKVRGHYTKNDTLYRYFRCMMWYGRMSFAIDSLYTRYTRMAAIITWAIHNLNLMAEWERVYLPTSFFVGKSDDINIYQYTKIMEEIYGTNFASLPVDTFRNNSLIEVFIAKADSLPGPMITTTAPKGFRFMGQRFIPDSWILDTLVYFLPLPSRFMPKGLDVMAVLGSERAYIILDSVYNEMNTYPEYAYRLNYLKAYFDDSIPDTAWAYTLSWNWLYCLMPFTFAKGEGFPTFMCNSAWLNKETYCALGSWTEYRHDVILYAKQSETPIGNVYEPPVIDGYVEPNPWSFARLASLTRYTRDGLDSLNLLFGDFGLRLIGLENLLLVLKAIAEKELQNELLNYGEKRAITGIGAEIGALVSFDQDYYFGSGYSGPQWYPDTSQDEIPVIADVHTDPNNNECLEEGVGYPFNIFVIVPINGELKVTWGAVFSYYEFIQPIENRLTDEQWIDTLQTDPPPPPIWITSFVDTSTIGAIVNPMHYFYPSDAIWEIQNFGVKEKEITTKEYFNVYPNLGNIFNIEYKIKRPTRISIKVYDVAGKLVATIFDNNQSVGMHKITWKNNRLPKGIYFIVFNKGGKPISKKLIYLR